MKKWYFTANVYLIDDHGEGLRRKLLVSGTIESDRDEFPIENINGKIIDICNISKKSKKTEIQTHTLIFANVINQVIVRSDLKANIFDIAVLLD